MIHSCLQQLDSRKEGCYVAYLSEQAVEITHCLSFLSSPTYTTILFLNNFFLRNLIYYQRIHNMRKISPQAFLPFLHAKSLASLLFLPLSSLALLPCLAAGTFEEIFLHPTSFPGCSSSIMVPLLRDLFSFSELCPRVPSLPWASIQPSHRITES